MGKTTFFVRLKNIQERKLIDEFLKHCKEEKMKPQDHLLKLISEHLRVGKAKTKRSARGGRVRK